MVTHTQHAQTHTDVHVWTQTCGIMYLYAHTHAGKANTHASTHTRTHANTYTHASTHTHAHTDTHTHTRTHTPRASCGWRTRSIETQAFW